MSKWREYKLGDVIQFGNGKERPKTEGSIPVFGGNGILGWCNKANYDRETIIIGRVGAYCGSVFYQNRPIWISDNALAAKPKAGFDTLFLFYYLKNLQLNSFAEGSSHPLVTQSLLNSIEVSMTENVIEQTAIAEVLSSLDDKIDLLHRQNKTLEQLAETLFRQWFVEEAQESWEEKRLCEILTITSSKRIFYSEYVPSGVPFYRSKEIIELRNTGSTNSELFISKDRFDEINNKFGSPKQGDILMTSVGTLGVAYRVKSSDRFYFKDGNLTWFKDFKEIPSSIVYLWLISRIGQEELSNIKIGSTQEALTIEGLRSISFKLPPKEKIDFYKSKFDLIIEKMDFNQTQIRTLTQLRDTLLPKLMSGEVRVNS